MGGTGLLGSGVVRRLVDLGHNVTATSRGNRPPELPRAADSVVVDRYDLAAMEALVDRVQPEVVVDGIAYTRTDAEDDLRLFSGRIGHLIMISSDFAYDPTYQRLPIDEDAPLRAGTPYSDGKVDCEEALFEQDELPITVFRPPHIMGRGGRFGSGSMQGRDSTLLDRLRQGVPVVLIDAGTYILQPLHVDDAGDAIAAAMGCEACFGSAYNLMSVTAAPTREYYELIARELGVRLDVLSVPGDAWLAAFPDQASFARHRIYDLGSIERDSGWAPRVTLDEAVGRTYREIVERGEDAPYAQTAEERAVLGALERGSDALAEALAAWAAK